VPGRAQTFFTIRLTGTGSGTPGNQVQAVAFSPQGNQLATSGLGTVRLWDVTTGRLVGGWGGTTENFIRIGHSLLALLVGWLGGLLSRRMWRASRPPEPETVGLP
jgi:WD40 repeat protein